VRPVLCDVRVVNDGSAGLLNGGYVHRKLWLLVARDRMEPIRAVQCPIKRANVTRKSVA